MHAETNRWDAVQDAAPSTDASASEQDRADFYRLFAGAFVEEPSQAYLEALREPQLLAALNELGAGFEDDFSAPPVAELTETLACEYATLFASPGGCAPVESARLTGRLQQQPFFAVQETYQRYGFEVRGARFTPFADQLGVELQFVAELLSLAGAARAQCDLKTAGALDKEVKRFWVQHLGLWVRGICLLIERASLHSFYRGMARLLRAFAEEELAAMNLRVEDQDGGRAAVPKSEIEVLTNPDEPECNACGGQSAAAGGTQPLHFMPAIPGKPVASSLPAELL